MRALGRASESNAARQRCHQLLVLNSHTHNTKHITPVNNNNLCSYLCVSNQLVADLPGREGVRYHTQHC